MSSSEVAVVGLGATGAFVARAAYDMGFRVTVYVHGTANVTPPGAFWLHWIPKDVSGDFSSKPITILGKGKPETYTRLQWGKSYYKGLTSSFPEMKMIEDGYNPVEVLPRLVPDEVKIEYVPYPFSDTDVDDLVKGFQHVFQTFPRKLDLEIQPERIPYVAASRMGVVDPEQNVVVYNGTGKGLVVREAYLFGNHFMEFPKHMTKADLEEAGVDLQGFNTIVLKDLAPNTNRIKFTHSTGRVHLMGRFAEWDRRCLSHDCYERTVEVLRHG
jgi:hypothetical protein